ncbi:MAG TPA: hypothetical protein VLL54_06670 [Pyrinomonadaceae bacterium]|nr:hypothetical protein [Pyrinomonadaceae bacterium]
MKTKLIPITILSVLVAVPLFAQRRPRQAPPPAARPTTARLIVQGTYEENYDGETSDGNATGKLTVKFEVSRWLTMAINELGNAEFSDLPGGQPSAVSGVVTYRGEVKGASGGDSYDAISNFTGGLADNDVVITTPQYNDTGTGLKLRVSVNPKIKGMCSVVAVRNKETMTSSNCPNGTSFFTAAMPLQFEDNDDPSKTTDTANIARFGIELDVEPPLGAQASGAAPESDDGGYAWRGAVTNGSKEAGFKILLDQKKEQTSDDKRGHTTRHLIFEATITPGTPK